MMKNLLIILFFLPINCFLGLSKLKIPCYYNIIDNLRKKSIGKYHIIDKSNDKLYSLDNLKNSSNFFKNKTVISISPGGLQGFYLVGIVNYIKNNYDLDNYLFTGASAGSWCSILMSYKYDTSKIVKCISDIDNTKLKSILDLQINLKEKMMQSFKSEDFDFRKTFIGVTVFKDLELSTNIFYNFENLEDAINCCIASSHIPILTGKLIYKYNNEISLDGGFSHSPYLDLNNTILKINPNIWISDRNTIIDYRDLIQDLKSVNFIKLYEKGYYDTKFNKYKLDLIFKNKFI